MRHCDSCIQSTCSWERINNHLAISYSYILFQLVFSMLFQHHKLLTPVTSQVHPQQLASYSYLPSSCSEYNIAIASYKAVSLTKHYALTTFIGLTLVTCSTFKTVVTVFICIAIYIHAYYLCGKLDRLQ